MSLERKDVRFKLDAEWHEALRLVAERDGCDIGEWVEQVVLPKLQKRVNDAMLLADALTRAGIIGQSRESARQAPESGASSDGESPSVRAVRLANEARERTRRIREGRG